MEQPANDHQPPPPKRRRPACAFYLSPVPANICLGLKTSLLAKAEFFGNAGTTRLGGNRVSNFSPFVSKPKFIQGIVSRWGVGGSGSFSGNFVAACPVPSSRTGARGGWAPESARHQGSDRATLYPRFSAMGRDAESTRRPPHGSPLKWRQ